MYNNSIKKKKRGEEPKLPHQHNISCVLPWVPFVGHIYSKVTEDAR
uniref:Uncharacterized protein n=1 Tax=Rhizophora mucronata TaxID=61149 RepID=A0A2P2NAC8_RHIMU